MFEINFKRDEEAESEVCSRGPLYTSFLEFSLRAGGESVFGELGPDGYFADFFYPFLATSLDALETLRTGGHYRFALEGPFELRFDADDDTVKIRLVADGAKHAKYVPDETFRVPLSEFETELVETTEEFIAFVREVCDDKVKRRELDDLRRELADTTR